MVVGAAGPPCWMTSITMSANSSDVDVVGGPGWVVGSALAVDIVNPERPMSTPANSSDVDVVTGPGAGGWVGSALAVPIANAESPIAAPATAANTHRIASVIPLLACAIPIPIAAQFDSPRS